MPLAHGYLRARLPLPQDCCDGCMCTIYRTTIYFGGSNTDSPDQIQTTIEPTIDSANNTPPPQPNVPTSPVHPSSPVQNGSPAHTPSATFTTLTSPTSIPTRTSTEISSSMYQLVTSTAFTNSIPPFSLAADISPTTSASVVVPSRNSSSGPIFDASSNPDRKSLNLGAILGGILGGLFLIALLVALAAYHKHRRNPSGKFSTLDYFTLPFMRRRNDDIAPFVFEPATQDSKGLLAGHTTESVESSSKASLAQSRPHSVVDVPPSYVP
ncbi:hypothetical protein BJ165DRAFT_1524410 [Panaeolus papilionaceus]|nr:hypothetical protein BJ165DRAFT_1524410 [Panaeolus papilionaceus]